MITGGFHKASSGKRSGSEDLLSKYLEEQGVTFFYEQYRLPYTQQHNYTPDFVLSNGVIIELKGGSDSFVKRIHGRLMRLPSFDAESRGKMLRIKKQYPQLDIRFVFMSDGKLSTGKRCSDWCKQHGFPYHIGVDIPEEWTKGDDKLPKELIKKGTK